MPKKLKPEFELAKRLPGKSQLERVIAARAMLDSRHNFSRRTEVAAFLSIFHPEMTERQRRKFLEGVKP